MHPARIALVVFIVMAVFLGSAKMACSRSRIVGGWHAELSEGDTADLCFRSGDSFSLVMDLAGKKDEKSMHIREDGTYMLVGSDVRLTVRDIYVTGGDPELDAMAKAILERDKEDPYYNKIDWKGGDLLILSVKDEHYEFHRMETQIPEKPSSDELASLRAEPDSTRIAPPQGTGFVPIPDFSNDQTLQPDGSSQGQPVRPDGYQDQQPADGGNNQTETQNNNSTPPDNGAPPADAGSNSSDTQNNNSAGDQGASNG